MKGRKDEKDRRVKKFKLSRIKSNCNRDRKTEKKTLRQTIEYKQTHQTAIKPKNKKTDKRDR